MSATHVVTGFTLAAAIVQGVILVTFPIPPIEVHSLNYDAGVIHQDRTITTDSEFFPAEWRATIISAETFLPVAGCTGRGFWNYTEGNRVAELALPVWVGQDGCTREYLQMIGGEFYPVASWHWGDEFTKQTGRKFRP
jgi:hypothetical protein